MTKLLSTLILAAVAMIGFNAQAASHVGAAPAMKASEAAASAPAKKKAKAAAKKASAPAKTASEAAAKK